MKRVPTLILIISIILFSSAYYLSGQGSPQNEQKPHKESSYDRLIRTNTLRCGYGTWAPGVYKDLETGEMKGLFVELTEAMGKLNNIKIEWTAEIDWGQIAESIKTGKIDAFCAGMANDALRGKFLAYSNPLSYWTFDVIVRSDDARFSSDVVTAEELNKAEFDSAYSEGDVLETIVKNEFPNVRGVALPPLGTPADNTMHVITGKTDFVVFPKVMFQLFQKENPGKLRYIKVEPPLRTYGNVIAVSIEDLKLQQVLNAAVNELVNSGLYVKIMARYEQDYKGAFIPVGGLSAVSK